MNNYETGTVGLKSFLGGAQVAIREQTAHPIEEGIKTTANRNTKLEGTSVKSLINFSDYPIEQAKAIVRKFDPKLFSAYQAIDQIPKGGSCILSFETVNILVNKKESGNIMHRILPKEMPDNSNIYPWVHEGIK